MKFPKIYKFSLRTLLLVVTILGIYLGWWKLEGQKLQRVTQLIANAGGRYEYYDKYDPNIDDNYFSLTQQLPPGTLYPEWLQGKVPNEYLGEILEVNLSHRKVSHKLFEAVGTLDKLKYLTLRQANFIADNLQYLNSCQQLERLCLDNTNISDKNLPQLAVLHGLETLSLENCDGITGHGLEKLKGLSNLRSLYLWGTNATQEDIENMAKAMPNCSIQLHPKS